MKDDSTTPTANLSPRPLCGTRWVLRLPALEAILGNYETIHNWLESIYGDNDLDGVTQSAARSHISSLENFATYFTLRLFERVLIAIHPVHRTMQDRKITMGQCKTLIENLIGVFSADVSF